MKSVMKKMCLLAMVAVLFASVSSVAEAAILDLGAATSYSDNYDTDPFARPESPFWSYSTVNWDGTNYRLRNSYSTNQTEVVYCITHDGAINAADIRLTSDGAPSTATAAFAINGGASIRVAVATAADGTYTDVYSGGWVQSQASNPGALVDLTSYGSPETLFVKIYSTPSSTGSHYIYWSGFQVELDAVPEPATLVLLGVSSVGMLLKRKRG